MAAKKHEVIHLVNLLSPIIKQFDELESLGPLNDTRLIEAKCDVKRSQKKLNLILSEIEKNEPTQIDSRN